MHLDVFFPYFIWLLYVRMLTLTDVLISEIQLGVKSEHNDTRK